MTFSLLPAFFPAMIESFKNNDFFFVLGEGDAAWDADPPLIGDLLAEPSYPAAPLGYKRCLDKRWVTPDVAGAIIVQGTHYTISTEPTLFLYLSGLFDWGEVPFGDFRELAVVINPTLPEDASPGVNFFQPEELLDPGTPVAYAILAKEERNVLIQEGFKFLISFD